MKIVNACLNMQKVENYCLNFESSECEKQIEISLEFCVLKFPDLFDFCNKDLKKIVLMIRKDVMYYEYIKSRNTFNEKSLSGKGKLLSEISN